MAGGRSLGGTGGLSPAAARTPATDPASPVRLLRRRPVGAPGPGRASAGSNARGGSVGCGFPPRHGSEDTRASHVVPDSAAQAAASEKLSYRPRARPPGPLRAHWPPRLGGGAWLAWPIGACRRAAPWTSTCSAGVPLGTSNLRTARLGATETTQLSLEIQVHHGLMAQA